MKRRFKKNFKDNQFDIGIESRQKIFPGQTESRIKNHEQRTPRHPIECIKTEQTITYNRTHTHTKHHYYERNDEIKYSMVRKKRRRKILRGNEKIYI